MKIKKYIILFLLFSVFGCQSESEKDNSNLVQEALPVTINAQNFVVTSEFGQSLTVDLDNKVAVSDKSAFTVSSIERLTNTSADCATPKIHNASLLISPLSESATAVCDYRYTVTSAAPITNDSVVSGVMRLVAPSPRATVTVLDMMPISAAVLVDGGVQTIDIAALLADAGEVLTGFTLLSTYSHAYPYAGGVTLSAASQTLDYTPAATVGHDRILFTYTNAGTNTNKLGILDIVVGESHNQGVTLIPTCYYPFVVPPNIETALDITTCVTTDHDGNDYGLNRVDAFYASVAIASAAWNEKNINFKASENRYHDVSYMIDDGKGGTEMGILRVAVGDADQLPGWEAIEINQDIAPNQKITQYFIAPKSVLESLYSNAVYSELLTDSSYSPAIDIAGYYANEVIGHCQSLGATLPTTQQLQDLVNNPAGKPQTLKDWPMAYHYLANDGTALAPDYRIVNLDDGTISTVTSGEAYFVSCYREGEFSIALTSSSRCAVPGDTLEYKTTVTTPFGPYANEYIHQSLSPTPTTATFNPAVPGDNYFTDSNGQFTFGITDTVKSAVTATANVAPSVVSDKGYFGYADISLNYSSYAALKPDGTVVAWGHSFEGGDASTLYPAGSTLTDVVSITAASAGYAALKSDGTVVFWGGHDIVVTPTGSTLDDVKSIVGGNGFAALKNDGTVVSWGNSYDADTLYPAGSTLTNVESITVSEGGFAALKTDGTVTAWGFGTDTSTLTPVGSTLTDVVKIFTSNYDFAALKDDGTVVAWGPNSGADVSSLTPTGSTLDDVKNIVSNNNAFVAHKKDGSVVAWGESSYGGNLNALTPTGSTAADVIGIVGASYAMAAWKSDGTAIAWGYSLWGGNANVITPTGSTLSDVKNIVSGHKAFAALKNDGTVVAWGDADSGGDANVITPAGSSLTNVKSIVNTQRAFAALKNDGTVVAWGQAGWGGDANVITPAGSSLTNVKSVISSYGAFAALKNDGTVVAWGNIGWGGDVSTLTPAGSTLTDVKSIVSNDSSFAAMKNDGSVVVWGNASRGGDASGVNVTHCD
ncbi:hypothetical protein [Vibrio hippocampi]|uniref:Lipoprotein n=1 Tax=Vibrio hippocampi TaxID=654686 RepID=A0ABN8DKI7_9VIBR|nr:hypothetical protein [Vibrio hippocampi]CAH0529834.1 hypothetical protein VHP8226_03590 [Vibrio hippocampi]